MNLYSYFLSNRGRPIHKNIHYFPVYQRHFERFAGQPLTMLEIGAGGGGSSQMWKHFLGPYARIVAIDVNPACRQFEDEQVKVRIGSQSDTGFLAEVVDEFGMPDIVLDDGSHRMDDIAATFDWLYPRTSRNGVYLVEDLHTAYWPEYGGGFRDPRSFLERCKDLVDELNAQHTRGALPPTDVGRSTVSMHFYDSVVVFERGVLPDTRSVVTGERQDY